MAAATGTDEASQPTHDQPQMSEEPIVCSAASLDVLFAKTCLSANGPLAAMGQDSDSRAPVVSQTKAD